ncbi:MAG: nucleotidyltransferase domain-containing protein [Anaerolineae bacterium]|jgi:hypothetical protein
MKSRPSFNEKDLEQLRDACVFEPRLAALYTFGPSRRSELDLAALFSESMNWPERLDLELCIAKALELDGVELVDLERMPLVFRHWVLNRGEPIYVGQPEPLAVFIEDTIARYSAFYPLLEALYWEVETRPRPEDMV